MNSTVSILVSETPISTSEWPNIAIIGAVAFLYTSKLSGSSKFQLYLHSLDIQANFAKLAEASDLSNISSKYYKFANIFSKTKTKFLASYHFYDFKINLKEDTQPLVGPIYSLLASEQETLKEFIEENLKTGFIQLISSPHSIPVLFAKKKGGSLHLYVIVWECGQTWTKVRVKYYNY